jgi:hypothetical protein
MAVFISQAQGLLPRKLRWAQARDLFIGEPAALLTPNQLREPSIARVNKPPSENLIGFDLGDNDQPARFEAPMHIAQHSLMVIGRDVEQERSEVCQFGGTIGERQRLPTLRVPNHITGTAREGPFLHNVNVAEVVSYVSSASNVQTERFSVHVVP